ncbi:MAG: YdcF family protein [Melioribacteraceae bacterium]|nr:YdcF family protein [Melioribacteraceae bacterium]
MELYNLGYANRILFTGGIGSGTADINCSEADNFETFTADAGIKDVIIENKSTNTPPKTSLEDEIILFRNKNENLYDHLIGEIERIKKYQNLNYIRATSIPKGLSSLLTSKKM